MSELAASATNIVGQRAFDAIDSDAPLDARHERRAIYTRYAEAVI
jgi:hypothetical protein